MATSIFGCALTRVRILGNAVSAADSMAPVLRVLPAPIWLQVAALSLILVTGCSWVKPESVPLTARHSLFFASRTLVMVIDTATRNVVVDGEVQELGVAGDLVFGSAKHFEVGTGFYFVLHSSTGHVEMFEEFGEMEAYVVKIRNAPIEVRSVARWR